MIDPLQKKKVLFSFDWARQFRQVFILYTLDEIRIIPIIEKNEFEGLKPTTDLEMFLPTNLLPFFYYYLYTHIHI